jgi:uncharacterized membrane protein
VPFNPMQLLGFVLILGLLLAFVQVGILTVAFGKLGLSSHSAFILLFASLFGSMINLPVGKIKAERPPLESIPEQLRAMMEQVLRKFQGQTIIAINAGGCLIPVMFSYYLIRHNALDLFKVFVATLIVTAISRWVSRPVPGVGIGMPIFIAPIAAALTAVGIDPEQSAPLAYICGTLGVLIGADLLRLKDIRKMGVPIASIGGAGTFDGIFITGIVAVLLA